MALKGETKIRRWLYNHSPIFIQNIMASIYGYQKIRYRYHSPKYPKWYAFYKETYTWPEEKIREYQWQEVKKILNYAYEHVPYYKEKLKKANIRPEDIQSVEDMEKIPYLEKEEVRNYSELLISDEYKKEELFSHPTSGSTGTPMTLYNDREATIRNYAIRWAQCRPGLSRKDKNANFTGLEILDPDQKKPPFWRMNWAGKQRLYSIFHMNDKTLPYYIEDLIRFNPVWIYGYPSAIYTLAEFIIRKGIDYPNPPKAIIVSSEECQKHYREAIEKAFKTKLWDEYGQGEMAGLAFECQCGKLHERPEYALMEFVPTGEKDEETGFDVYELICTSFINKAWPLIRYRVGDLAVIDPNAKCPLGRNGKVIERIYGRTGHFLIASDGSKISNISVIAKKCRNIKKMQVIQEELGKIKVLIVPDHNYEKERDEPFTIEQFRKKLGDESRMKIEIKYVDNIPLTKAGKYLSIVSKIGKEHLQAY